ncbi:Protein male abnormal 3 [Trichinella sp. T6]|nr:Protein male abnormal 3 [Trichinella sp. T6]
MCSRFQSPLLSLISAFIDVKINRKLIQMHKRKHNVCRLPRQAAFKPWESIKILQNMIGSSFHVARNASYSQAVSGQSIGEKDICQLTSTWSYIFVLLRLVRDRATEGERVIENSRCSLVARLAIRLENPSPFSQFDGDRAVVCCLLLCAVCLVSSADILAPVVGLLTVSSTSSSPLFFGQQACGRQAAAAAAAAAAASFAFFTSDGTLPYVVEGNNTDRGSGRISMEPRCHYDQSIVAAGPTTTTTTTPTMIDFKAPAPPPQPALMTTPASPIQRPAVKAPMRTYHCQRCLNHGKEVARKGHKRFCEWASCTCVQCVLVERRKMLNREINSECERSQQPGSSSSSSNGSDREAAGRITHKRKSRNPKCARCGVHARHMEPPPLKGHKKVCPYQECACYKCQLVTQRRSVMARQIHLRRSQKAKQKNGSVIFGSQTDTSDEKLNMLLANDTASSITSVQSVRTVTNGGCPMEMLMSPPSMLSVSGDISQQQQQQQQQHQHHHQHHHHQQQQQQPPTPTTLQHPSPMVYLVSGESEKKVFTHAMQPNPQASRYIQPPSGESAYPKSASPKTAKQSDVQIKKKDSTAAEKQQLWKICTSRSFCAPSFCSSIYCIFKYLYTCTCGKAPSLWKPRPAERMATERGDYPFLGVANIQEEFIVQEFIHERNPSTVLNSLYSTTAHPTHHQWLPVSSRADQGGNDQLLASLIARLQSTLLRNAASSANILDSPSSVGSFLPTGCFLQPLGSSSRWNLPLFTMAFLSTPEDLQRLSLQLNQHFTMKNFTTFPLERCKNNKLSV